MQYNFPSHFIHSDGCVCAARVLSEEEKKRKKWNKKPTGNKLIYTPLGKILTIWNVNDLFIRYIENNNK